MTNLEFLKIMSKLIPQILYGMINPFLKALKHKKAHISSPIKHAIYK